MSEVEDTKQQPFIPGLSQPCLMCPYKDAYLASKSAGELMVRAQQAQVLIQNLTTELEAATIEIEKYKSKAEN